MKKAGLLFSAVLLSMFLFAIPAFAYDVRVEANDVYLRSGAGANYSAVLSNPLPYGTVVSVSQEATAANGNPWGYVYYGGFYGWIALKQCSTVTSGYNVRVAAYDVYLRSGAGAGYGAVLSSPIPYGTVLTVTQEAQAANGNYWGYVYYGGSYGWVALTQCPRVSSGNTVPSSGGSFELAKHVNYNIRVSAPDGGVNLRSAAGVEYGRLLNYLVPNGALLHVFFEDVASNGNSWGFVKYDGVWGWVALTQCTRVNEAADSTPAYSIQVNSVDGGVNLRSGAGVEYSRLLNHLIPNGTILKISEERIAANGNYWGLTTYEGVTGWVTLREIIPAVG